MTRYLFDSCSFKSMLNDDHTCFNYSKIIDEVKSGQSMIVVTPYTIYEVFKYLKDVSQFREESLKLAFKTEFWVKDIDGVLGSNSYEQGVWFVFKFHIHTDSEFEKFNAELDKYENDIINSIKETALMYAKVLAKMFLVLKYLKPNGKMDSKASFALKVIDNAIKNNEILWKNIVPMFHLRQNTNEEIVRQIVELIVTHSISDAFAWYDLATLGIPLNDPIAFRNTSIKYRVRFNTTIEKLSDELTNLKMNKAKEMNKSKIKKDISQYVLDGTNPIEAYEMLLNCNYLTNDVFNDIIDLRNYSLACSMGENIIYLTEEKKWIDLIYKSSNKSLELTKEFYKNNYKKI